jgi:hypothetical protein
MALLRAMPTAALVSPLATRAMFTASWAEQELARKHRAARRAQAVRWGRRSMSSASHGLVSGSAGMAARVKCLA